MNAILTKLGESSSPVVFAAVVALFGAIVSAIIALLISRRTTYLTAVTAERSKWIDKLRNNIAELAGICAYIHSKGTATGLTAYSESSPEYDELLMKIENLEALIQLQLNPRGRIDQNIIEILQKIAHLAKMHDFRMYSAHWLLIHHAQWLLKEEWETVKYEAAGSVRRIVATLKRWWRARQYRKFCEWDGSLADIRQEQSQNDGAAAELQSAPTQPD
jgi:hypothetical protein